MMRTSFAALVCAVWWTAAMPGATKKVIFPEGSKTAGPYSPGILAGGFLFISGQGAKGPDGTVFDIAGHPWMGSKPLDA